MRDPEDTAGLLSEVALFLSRFVILTQEQLVAVSSWVLLSYVYEAWDTVPYLIVTSAEKRSGKTRVLECIQSVCRNPITVTGLTEAVLFRIMEQRPTLLIDETDTIFNIGKNVSERQENLRAILNAGYRRGTVVYRCAPNGELVPFPVFGCKVLAGIGHLPDTIEDRGLPLRLRRKLPSETVERFRFRDSVDESKPLKEWLESWASGRTISFLGTETVMPEELDDRAQDAYEGLVAIGDLAGGRWPTMIRNSLVALRSEAIEARESMGMRLLRDIRLVLHHFEDAAVVPTVELLDWLYAEGQNEWVDWWGPSDGRKAARRLAMTLAEYEVTPRQWNNSILGSSRGYAVGDLTATIRRYVPEEPQVEDEPEEGQEDPPDDEGILWQNMLV